MAVYSPSEFLSSQPPPLSQMSDVTRLSRKRKAYRPARPIPYELRQHCVTFLEEKLYAQAFSLLQSLLIAGVDSNDDEDNCLLPAYVPHAQIVALAATLIVHPALTNRAPTPEHMQSANDALFYLDHLNALVGPSTSNFTTAFQFVSARASRPDRRRRTHNPDSPEDEDDHGRLRLNLANNASLWNQAEDFWSVVGWAFNCSVRHPKRWSRWKLWLTFMLDVLENDLEANILASKAKLAQGDLNASKAILSESMLARYLAVVGESRAGKRRVMRAILADGNKKSLAEFGEIWKNETKERKPPEQRYVDERKKLNVDEGDFGDYMDVDEDEVDGEEEQVSFGQSTSSMKRSTRKRQTSAASASRDGSAAPDDTISSSFGDTDSISLRQRFMKLLTDMCHHHEQAFLDTDDLFDLYTEFLRPLPLHVFVQFVLPSEPFLEPNAQASVNQDLLRILISSDAPTYKAETMTQKEFETHFLPYPANYTNHLENARVSVLVEGLLRLLVRYLDLQVDESFMSKLEEGISARKEKAKFGARKLTGEKEAEEELAVGVLEMSSMRMRMLLRTITG